MKKIITAAYIATAVLMTGWTWMLADTVKDVQEPVQPNHEPVLIIATEEPIEVAVEEQNVMTTIGRYEQIAQTISAKEKALTALVVYHESRGEPIEGQIAVAEVVFNRTLSEYGGATSITDVIYADGQFSCADALTNAAIREPACLTTAYEVVDAVLASTTYIVPEYYMYFSTSQPKTSDFKQIGHHYFR